VKALFEDALEKTKAEQIPFLAQAEEDPEVASEVEFCGRSTIVRIYDSAT
jgi:hypothetical protein